MNTSRNHRFTGWRWLAPKVLPLMLLALAALAIGSSTALSAQAKAQVQLPSQGDQAAPQQGTPTPSATVPQQGCCGNLSIGITGDCTPNANGTTSFWATVEIVNQCQTSVQVLVTVGLQVSTNQIDWNLWAMGATRTVVVPPGPTPYSVQELFNDQSIPAQYRYYRYLARVSEPNYCREYFPESQPRPICRLGGTATPTPTVPLACCHNVTASGIAYCTSRYNYNYWFTITNGCNEWTIGSGTVYLEYAATENGTWYTVAEQPFSSRAFPPGQTVVSGALTAYRQPDYWYRARMSAVSFDGCWTLNVPTTASRPCIVLTSTPTPTPTRTSTATSYPTVSATPGCCTLDGTIQTSCSYDPGSNTHNIGYSADIVNSCGSAISVAANFYLEVSADGATFEWISRSSIQNYTFQPGHNFISDSFSNQSIPAGYAYYRVRMQIYDCGIYSIYSPSAWLCGIGTQTTTPIATPSRTATHTATTATRTIVTSQTPVATAASTSTPTSSSTRTATGTAALPTSTNLVASPTPTTCSITFLDVPPDHTFYASVRCLACRGIISGYADGTFKPDNLVTRSQLAKIVSNAAGFTEDPGPQIFQDVPPDHPFYYWINRLTNRGYMSGYTCGSPGEPCVNNRPYFRPFADATRAQTSKIVSNAAQYNDPPTGLTFEDVPASHPFYEWIQRLASRGVMGGYNCGGPGEPCMPGNRPYFRPYNNVTRGQSAKIVGNTFGCNQP